MASISVIEANTPSGNVIPPQAEAMIEVKDLVKDYGPTRAVNGISFRVNKGEILGFLGPNGAGKSTTMRILTCYTPATSGLARIGGFDTHRQSEEARRLLGYLPESAPLYLDMYVRSYLNFMHEVKGYPRAKRRAAVDEALEECGLTQVAGRLIRNLSKGYRQRVGLAQAIIGDPKVMVLDEPTVGLDPGQIAEIRQLAATVDASGGRRIDIERYEDAAAAFQQILTELREQYVLGYYPDRVRHNGAWHPLRIEVERKETALRTREGYFDD